MIGRIVHHEWRALASDATVWVVAAIFGIAIGYGVWNGSRWVAFQTVAIGSAATEEATRYEQLQAQVTALQQPGAKV